MKRTERSLQRMLAIGGVVLCVGARSALADIHTDLEVRYRLDDAAMSSTAADSSTNNRNGTLNGDATYVPTGGRINGAVEFDGTNDYVSIPAINATDGADELTVAFWLNTDGRDDFDVLCSKYEDDSNFFAIQVGSSGIAGADDLIVYIHNGSQGNYVYTTGDVLGDGKWIHVAVVYDGSQTGRQTVSGTESLIRFLTPFPHQ